MSILILTEQARGILYDQFRAFASVTQTDSNGIVYQRGHKSICVLENQSEPLSTTDDTVTTIATFEAQPYATMLVTANIVARRSGGDAGDDEDGLAYEIKAAFKNVAGAATQMGSTTNIVTEKDQVGWDCVFDVSGANINIKVNGAVDNNVDWLCYYTIHLIKIYPVITPP